MFTLPEHLRVPYERALEEHSGNFDPKLSLLRAWRGPNGYHTTLSNCEVHLTRESMAYALAILDRGTEGDVATASKIIDRVLELQDLDSTHDTYGIWPWYSEEPLSMMAPPDWNWADFIGKYLVQLIFDHSEILGSRLTDKMKTALKAAAYAIKKRDVPPSYTNISIMGMYVTLMAGELLQDGELLEYGRKRLDTLYCYNLYNGAFTEYNSPTYTFVAVEDLSLMCKQTQDEATRGRIKELNDLLWFCIARHFHAVTRQWAGPHSRCYSTLQGKRLLSLIQLATDGKVRFLEDSELDVDITWPRMEFHCPEKYHYYFTDKEDRRYYSEEIFKQEPRVKATSLITPSFTLGSFNRCDLWNQRRPMILYWGEVEKPSYLRVRCLNEGYDFSSAVLGCHQDRNLVLGLINFSIDHGTKHFVLDKIIDGKLMTSSLKITFEFGGAVDEIDLPHEIMPGKPLILRAGSCKIGLMIQEALFDGEKARIALREENQLKCIDLILYEGEKKEIDLKGLKPTVALFSLLAEEPKVEDEVLRERFSFIKADVTDQQARVCYEDENKEMKLWGSTVPQLYDEVIMKHGSEEKMKIKSSHHIWVVQKQDSV